MNRSKKRLISFLLSFFFVFLIARADGVSFCVQAHEDDWQLFNSKNIINDISRDTKIVFITVTAGNIGQKGDENQEIYYIYREKASVFSSKFVADLFGKPEVLSSPEFVEVSYVNNGVETKHQIKKYVYKNTVNYFLRLPDGNRDGKGFAETNGESLMKLRRGDIHSITAVDNSAHYNGWDDLVRTIGQIVKTESANHEHAWMYLDSTDPKYNSQSHKDHNGASEAALDAVKNMPWVGVVEWMSYASNKKKSNLTNSEYENAVAVFAVYCHTLSSKAFPFVFDALHRSWLSMDYSRVYRYPAGTSSQLVDYSGITRLPLLSGIEREKGSGKDLLIVRVNVVEKGTLTVKIFSIRGEVLADKVYKFNEPGVKDIEISSAEQVLAPELVHVVLNDRYFDSQKIM